MKTQNQKNNIAFIMVVYLLGIFMGAIDTGIVTPARTVIQNFMGVDDKTGIWMITMYTLAYAASIPIMGKLADKYGRKYIYLTSISLFGLGSLLCGLSQNFGNFTFLLIARAIQAIGGGGILPVATAEFGTTFPKEKRGMALGLVGGVYGIANIFGASAGSAILDIFGTDQWQFIFYINVPITLFIIIGGLIYLPNSKAETVKKTDYLGITVLTVMILSVLYGLKNIDFFEFGNTISSTKVYPFLLIFIVLLPLFYLIEKKAEDPVMNMSYFKRLRIIITLILSFMTGVVMMGMIFVPEFSENALKISSGSGGYFVLILGLFAGVGAPVSGKLIDKYGVKIILGFGFFVSAAGSLFLVFITANYPNMFTVVFSLMLVGLGIGFTMGTPLNYMMLENTKLEEANSALATVSLVRSIGTAIAPAIMIGFIAHAGANVQTNIMTLLPSEVAMPPLPYEQELTESLDKMKANPAMADKLAGVNIPDFSSMKTVKFDMNSMSGDFEMPQELIDRMQASDVTTITDDMKYMSSAMFDLMTPGVISSIQEGIQTGITSMEDSATEMTAAITGMQAAVDAQAKGIDQLESMADRMAAITSQTVRMEAANTSTEMAAPTFNDNTSFSIIDMIPEEVKASIPEDVLQQLTGIKSLEELKAKIEEWKKAKDSLEAQISSMKEVQAQITDTSAKMTALKDAIPGAFIEAKETYLDEINKLQPVIEKEYQTTLNGGFKQLYLTAATGAILALLLLLLYKKNKVSEGIVA